MEIHEKLAQLRKEKGLSQMEVASELGVSRQAVSRWERGVTVPTSDNLFCLGQLYGVTLDELVYGTPEEPVKKPPDESEAGENILSEKPSCKKIVGVAAFICICSILLLWGVLTNSLTIAKSLLVFIAVLYLLGSLVHSLCTIARHESETGENVPNTKPSRKKAVEVIAFICICGILLLWGSLTKSTGMAVTLLASVAFLAILGWFMYGMYIVIIYIKRRSGKK